MIKEKEKIRKQIINIYKEVTEKDIEEEKIQDGLLEQLHIDSLIALQIIVKMEQDFKIVIEDDDVAIKMLDSIENATDFIMKNSKDIVNNN
ncbi:MULTISPECIES: acyl carrier protein [Clostridium]|uniref:acyl carrier protein n=1 Tax=Clostridium TaxID=1485 RepID=UPI000824C63E|nr:MULTISPECIES: acyl carrier protein [Clostridium]PJI06511.1 hypothetical protein CUB90_00905 [Clostridium sp. CT7]